MEGQINLFLSPSEKIVSYTELHAALKAIQLVMAKFHYPNLILEGGSLIVIHWITQK